MVDNTKEPLELPLLYKFILKFPKSSIENFSPVFQGVFWVLVVPIFLVCYVFLNLVLLVFLFYPFNYVAVGTITFLLVMFIFRILLERALNSANAVMRGVRFRRELDEVLQDYLHLCKKEEIGEGTEKDETSKE